MDEYELIEKYFQGALTCMERVDLLRKAETDADLKNAFIRRQYLEALIAMSPQAGDREKALADYKRFIRARRVKLLNIRILRFVRYAAVAACIAGLTWFLAKEHYAEEPVTETTEVKFNSILVPAGQRVKFTLEDGTSVWLNSQTSLTYPVTFAENERRVDVEGEALFDVAKDEARPFIVSCKRVDIEALGTQFNVYDYPSEKYSRISLIEGKVSVYSPKKPDVKVELNPDEEVTVGNGKMSVGKIPNNDYFLWRDGIYSFDNERFEIILRKLELYYDISIEVQDRKMLDWRYTVKFRQRDGIDEIMYLLRRIHKFSFKKDNENNRITIGK